MPRFSPQKSFISGKIKVHRFMENMNLENFDYKKFMGDITKKTFLWSI